MKILSTRPILYVAGTAAAAAAVVGLMTGGTLIGGLAGGKASADDINYFSEDRLKADCDGTYNLPDGQGTGVEGWLDGCHYEESEHHDYWRWSDATVNGNLTPVNLCNLPSSAHPAQDAQNYSITTTATWSIGLTGTPNIIKGEDTLGSFGITGGYGQSTANTWGESKTMDISGQQKGTWAFGQKMHHSEGRIRVNYSTPVGPDGDKHYWWYINNVKIDTPYTNDNKNELSGGHPGIITQNAQDLVGCNGGTLLGDMNPPYKDTSDENPPSTNLTDVKEVTDSKAVAP